MLETIVAMGIDDPTAQILTTEGYALETPAFNSLYNRMANAPTAALILGAKSDLGADFVGQLRASHIDTPAIRIVNGPRGENWSHACAQFLNSGGDDVIIGPPDPAEVAFSVQAVCRRTRADRIERFEADGLKLEVNITKEQVSVNGHFIFPTLGEISILLVLASAKGIVSRSRLPKAVRGWREFNKDSVHLLVCRLRKQLGDAACLLVNHWGIGYELVGRVH